MHVKLNSWVVIELLYFLWRHKITTKELSEDGLAIFLNLWHGIGLDDDALSAWYSPCSLIIFRWTRGITMKMLDNSQCILNIMMVYFFTFSWWVWVIWIRCWSSKVTPIIKFISFGIGVLIWLSFWAESTKLDVHWVLGSWLFTFNAIHLLEANIFHILITLLKVIVFHFHVESSTVFFYWHGHFSVMVRLVEEAFLKGDVLRDIPLLCCFQQ